MHLKKFILIYLSILVFGLLLLSFKDMVFIYSAESQAAKVDHYVPGKTETFYKLGGSYEQKMLTPAILYAVNGEQYTYVTNYNCKDGCHEIGSDITIFYNKERPKEVLVSSFGDFWKYKVYFLIVMGVLLITTLPYLYYHVTKK